MFHIVVPADAVACGLCAQAASPFSRSEQRRVGGCSKAVAPLTPHLEYADINHWLFALKY